MQKNYYDDDINTVMKLLQQARHDERSPKELLSKSSEAKIVWPRRTKLEIKDNKLFLKKDDATHLILPSDRWLEIIRDYHENLCHIGIKKH